MSFPQNFIWGAAAASYQIEGSTQSVDGCADSVWDMCCRQEGFVAGGDTGFTACDHYRRYKEDVALMKAIGLKAYRLSIMWPRLIPEGTGEINPKGADFYDALIDELLHADIVPWITLFHWDYPAALFRKGGWLNPDSPKWFEEYTQVIVDRYSDRVQNWFTLNKPACFVGLGHQAGTHAPGLRLPHREVSIVWHHALLAHGRAVRVIRESSVSPDPKVGFAPCFRTTIPESASEADIEAARSQMFTVQSKNVFEATWNLEPCMRGRYPEDGLEIWGEDAPVCADGDLELIQQELDFIGLNIYQSTTVRAGKDGLPEVVPYPSDHPRTAINWPVTPDALRWASKFLYERYRKPVIITENGLSTNDWVSLDGKVHDTGRIDFLSRYISGLKTSMDEGVEVLGYFHWSIMDNFEWAEGYKERFGLIHIDYPTQTRTIKDSGLWYRDLIRSHGSTLSPDSNPRDTGLEESAQPGIIETFSQGSSCVGC
jgi:beta-glucosidase